MAKISAYKNTIMGTRYRQVPIWGKPPRVPPGGPMIFEITVVPIPPRRCTVNGMTRGRLAAGLRWSVAQKKGYNNRVAVREERLPHSATGAGSYVRGPCAGEPEALFWETNPGIDATVANSTFHLLGWNGVTLDYKSLQLAIAWLRQRNGFCCMLDIMTFKISIKRR